MEGDEQARTRAGGGDGCTGKTQGTRAGGALIRRHLFDLLLRSHFVGEAQQGKRIAPPSPQPQPPLWVNTVDQQRHARRQGSDKEEGDEITARSEYISIRKHTCTVEKRRRRGSADAPQRRQPISQNRKEGARSTTRREWGKKKESRRTCRRGAKCLKRLRQGAAVGMQHERTDHEGCEQSSYES